MKNIIIYLAAISIITGLSSCKKEQPLQQSYFGFSSYEEAEANLGVHIHYFDLVEGGIFMQATEQGNSGTIRWQLGAIFADEVGLGLSDGGTYYLNEHKFTHNGQSYSLDGGDRLSDEEKGAIAAPMYGQTNTFRLERDGDNVFVTDYYIPELIKVSNIPENGFEVSQNDNINIEWNADNNNEHGVVIFLNWNGLNMSDYSSSQEMNRGLVVEDTGSATINSNFFEDIPVGANFSIYVVRGNAELKDADDNRSYTVNSHTMHRLSCQIVQ